MKTRTNTESEPDSLPLFSRLLSDESGQDLIEYALICCFIAMGAVASMKSLVTAILAVVSSIGSTLTTAT
jgi:pilus assembly protein Flp/PilA